MEKEKLEFLSISKEEVNYKADNQFKRSFPFNKTPEYQ